MSPALPSTAIAAQSVASLSTSSNVSPPPAAPQPSSAIQATTSTTHAGATGATSGPVPHQRNATSYQLPSILTARLNGAIASGHAKTDASKQSLASGLDAGQTPAGSAQRRPPMVKDALTEEAKLQCRVEIEIKRVAIRRYEVEVQQTGGKGTEERHATYMQDQRDLAQLVHHLRLLLLRGGAYTMRICHKGQQVKKVSDLDFQGVVDVNGEGVIRLFRLQEDGPPETFYIHQLARCERRADAGHIVRIDWTNGKSLQLVLQENEVPEFIDVLRVQEDRYQRRRFENINKLTQLWELKRIPFDATNATHREMLLTLWQTVFPNEPLQSMTTTNAAEKPESENSEKEQKESLMSTSWSLLGFQGKYPPTDFRAMGFLSLYNMLYLAESRSKYLQTLLEPGRLKAGQSGGERDYPWATAAINVTAMMVKLLNLSDEQMTVHVSDPSWDSRLLTFFSSMSSEDNLVSAIATSDKQEAVLRWHHPLAKDAIYRYHEHAFEETFCFIMNVLDTMFMDAAASYMDFPIIFQRCEAQFLHWLSLRPTSIAQLYQLFLDNESSQNNKSRHSLAIMPLQVPRPYLHQLIDVDRDPPWTLYRGSPTSQTTSSMQSPSSSSASGPPLPPSSNAHIIAPSSPAVLASSSAGGLPATGAQQTVDIDDYRSLQSSATSIDRPTTSPTSLFTHNFSNHHSSSSYAHHQNSSSYAHHQKGKIKEVPLELMNLSHPSATAAHQPTKEKGRAFSISGPASQSPVPGRKKSTLPWTSPFSRSHGDTDPNHTLSSSSSPLNSPTSSRPASASAPQVKLDLALLETDGDLPDFEHIAFSDVAQQAALSTTATTSPASKGKPRGPRPLTANKQPA